MVTMVYKQHTSTDAFRSLEVSCIDVHDTFSYVFDQIDNSGVGWMIFNCGLGLIILIF